MSESDRIDPSDGPRSDEADIWIESVSGTTMTIRRGQPSKS